MPTEPPPSRWEFPPATTADLDDVVGQGADLEPGTLLAAYRGGIFPMPVRRHAPMLWWSPASRGILPLDRLRTTRSLRKSCQRYEVRVDTAFARVTRACADPARPDGWITPEVVAAYETLHSLGWAHSVETWTPDGELVGGLYGVVIGGLFAGESMFHWERDASKVALVALVEMLRADEHEAGGRRLLDLQWCTAHLASLGAIEIPRAEYLRRLRDALPLPEPAAFDDGAGDGAGDGRHSNGQSDSRRRAPGRHSVSGSTSGDQSDGEAGADSIVYAETPGSAVPFADDEPADSAGRSDADDGPAGSEDRSGPAGSADWSGVGEDRSGSGS